MKFKRFLPNKRTLIASLLIIVLLVSMSVGMGYARFTDASQSTSFSYQVKNYSYPADKYVVLPKDSASTGSYRFVSPDGNVTVTYNKASANETYQNAEYLVAYFDPKEIETDYTKHDRQVYYRYEIGIDYINFEQELLHPFAFLQSSVNSGANGGIAVYINFPAETDASNISYTPSYTVPDNPVVQGSTTRIAFGNIQYLGGYDQYNRLTHALFELNFNKKSWAAYADTDWYSDTQTVFTIDTAEELAGLAKLVNSGKTFEGKTVKLGEDIDLSDDSGYLRRWIPIGITSDHPFKGSFDGQNHTITGLNVADFNYTLKTSDSVVGAGLFGCVSGDLNAQTVIKNLTIDTAYLAVSLTDKTNANAHVTIGSIGTLAGYVFGCDVTNVKVMDSNICGAAICGACIVGYCDEAPQYDGCSYADCSFNSGFFTLTGGNFAYRRSADSNSADPPTSGTVTDSTPDEPH